MDKEEKEYHKEFLKDFERDLDRDIKNREKSIKSKVKILEKGEKSLITKPILYKILQNFTDEISKLPMNELSKDELLRVERMLIWMRDVTNILDNDNPDNTDLTKLRSGYSKTILPEYKVNLIDDTNIEIDRRKGLIYRKP